MRLEAMPYGVTVDLATRPRIRLRPEVCRETGCGAPAARPDGLCASHGLGQERRRLELPRLLEEHRRTVIAEGWLEHRYGISARPGANDGAGRRFVDDPANAAA